MVGKFDFQIEKEGASKILLIIYNMLLELDSLSSCMIGCDAGYTLDKKILRKLGSGGEIILVG